MMNSPLTTLITILTFSILLINITFSKHYRYSQITWKLIEGTTVEFTADIGYGPRRPRGPWPGGMGPGDMPPFEMRGEMSDDEMNPSEMGPGEMGPGEMGLGFRNPSGRGPGEMEQPGEMDQPGEMGPGERGPRFKVPGGPGSRGPGGRGKREKIFSFGDAKQIKLEDYPYDIVSELTHYHLNEQETIRIKRYIFRHTYPNANQQYHFKMPLPNGPRDLIVGRNEDTKNKAEGYVSFNNNNKGTPISNISPIIQFKLGKNNIIPLNPIDNDNENIKCRKATFLESKIETNNFYDATPDCKLLIYRDSLIYQPGDKWAAQIKMETENGDSTPLDFIFEAVKNVPKCDFITKIPESGSFNVELGNTLNVDLIGNIDSDIIDNNEVNNDIEIVEINIPQGSNISPSDGSIIDIPPAYVRFKWTPEDEQIGAFSAAIGIKNNGVTNTCTIPITVNETHDCDECHDGIEECESLNCSNADENPLCIEHGINGHGCEKCDCDSFMKSAQHKCVDCSKAITGCVTCLDYQGCIQCDYKNNWEWFWDDNCRIGRCRQKISTVYSLYKD